MKRLSIKWPHLRNILQKLDLLQTSRRCQPNVFYKRAPCTSVRRTLPTLRTFDALQLNNAVV
jgi:hypothetical protein